jgi:hypothetical protein
MQRFFMLQQMTHVVATVQHQAIYRVCDNNRSYVPRYYYYYYYLTAIGLTPGGSSTVHIYTQTVHRIQRTEPDSNVHMT